MIPEYENKKKEVEESIENAINENSKKFHTGYLLGLNCKYLGKKQCESAMELANLASKEKTELEIEMYKGFVEGQNYSPVTEIETSMIGRISKLEEQGDYLITELSSIKGMLKKAGL